MRRLAARRPAATALRDVAAWAGGSGLGGSFLLIFPGAWSDLAGVVCFVIVLVSQRAARVAGATEAA